jgi:polysaccharide export outer membrane protein
VLLAGWFAAGCGHVGTGTPQFYANGTPNWNPEESPDSAGYRLQGGDTVDIRFPYHPEENTRTVVRPDGKITLAVTGEIAAAGLTAGELTEVVTARAGETLIDPVVTVAVQPGENLRVYVGGEVENPGFVAYRPGLTAIQAIYDRGGVKPTADPERVSWVTGVKPTGEYQVRRFSLPDALSGVQNSAPVLSPNDVLVVPPSVIGKLNQFVELYLRGMLPNMPRFPPGIVF